jgi:hypothetical protein
MSFIKEIYSYQDLKKLIHKGIITESFWVSSTNVNMLEGVKEIRIGNNGTVHFQNLIDVGELEYVDCSFSFFGNLSSLKKLKYIGGQFRFGAPLRSLGLLEEIKGDLRPTTNDLEDLGCLQKVGGTVDLRGMIKITNLSPLREVGDNLNLVKSLKDQYNLKKVRVKGRIIYWNTEPHFYKDHNELISLRLAPPWENLGPYEFENNLVFPNKEQLDFYNYFKEQFLNGEYVDVGGMRNYVRLLIYEIRDKYSNDFDFEFLTTHYALLREHYPNLSHDTTNIEVKIGRKLQKSEYLLITLPYEEEAKRLNTIKELVISMPRDSLTEDNDSEDDLVKILAIGFKEVRLTEFGRQHLQTIQKKTINTIRAIENKEHGLFCRKFLDKNKFYRSDIQSGEFNPSIYKGFFDREDEYEFFLKEHNRRMHGVPKENVIDPKYFPPIVEFAIKRTIGELLRKSENELRTELGLPAIGEGWINETELYHKIKIAYPELIVQHHGRPKWLGLQHFDIYFPELNIAVEYQGIQHFEEVEIFGGKEGLKKTQFNDQIKREKCIKNACTLIEITPDDDFSYVLEKINNSIKNINLKDKSLE